MEAMEALHRIVAADKAAREGAADALRAQSRFDERLHELSREIGENAMAQAQSEIDEARKASDSTLARTLEALGQECAGAMESMKTQYAAKKNEGVEAMFRMVVGLDD